MDPVACPAWKVDAIQQALKEGVLNDEASVAMIYNLTEFRGMLQGAVAAFPRNFLHTMAVKANPVLSFLKEVRDQGLGLETASLGELSLALEAGVNPQKIVFDSPAKTIPELKLALEKGIYLNLDNFQEFERVKKLMETGQYKNSNIGIRVNPQVGGGAIEALSTATATSKFGIPTEYLPQLMEAYKQYSWLNGIHVHVGSQGCPLDLIAQGIRKAVDMALSINQARAGQIKYIDIGGGLPVNFETEEVTPTFEAYSTVLRKHIPELFTDEFVVITEFGRTYNAKVGIVAAKVEYTKLSGGRGIAVIQAGADLFVRTVYNPEKWPLRVAVLDPSGNLKTGENDKVVWDIAGPCCFSGDIVAHRRALPAILPGDVVLVHDTGSYYFSSFSHYNCRQAPPIYGYVRGANLTVMKKGETVADTIRFYS
jgi:diaminopimelate decarboxylase